MKKFLVGLLAVAMLSLGGCNSAAKVHKGVFGCWPQGYTPPRELDAVGPKESNCGKPVYKKPACAERTDCPDCVAPTVK